jgi:uncharacterized coiled-coil protein SlyX
MLGGSSAAAPVFSEEHIQFLAPQIARALATATERDSVAFLVRTARPRSGQADRPVMETTTGSLYAYGLSLYVTLSQYRYSADQPQTDSMAHRHLPDTSGLSNRTLQFIPRIAQRPDNFYQPLAGAPTDRMVAIDYQQLQHEPPSEPVVERALPRTKPDAPPAPQPKGSPGESDVSAHMNAVLAARENEIRTLKDLVIQKDLELDSLRKALQALQQQLDQQRLKQERPKRKSTPPSPAP